MREKIYWCGVTVCAALVGLFCGMSLTVSGGWHRHPGQPEVVRELLCWDLADKMCPGLPYREDWLQRDLNECLSREWSRCMSCDANPSPSKGGD